MKKNREREHGLFPFKLVYKDKKSPQSELPDHQHNDYEIVYVYSGKGTFFIDSVFFEMGAGDLFMIPKDVIHRAIPDKEDPVTSSILFFTSEMISDLPLGDSFSFTALFETVKLKKHYKLSSNGQFRDFVQKHIELIHEELTAGKQGYRLAAKLILQQMILNIARQGIGDEDSIYVDTPALSNYPWLDDIFMFIEEHLDRNLNLSALARKALVSPEHFSRVFKQMTGMSLTTYLHSKRTIRAKELLLQSQHTIAAIAQMCGFETLSHFHRVFKKYTGFTPASYRRLHRK